MPPSHLCRIEIQLLGDLIEMNFQRITWLRRSVPALRSTRRFVRENARSLKFVTRHFVSNGLERAGVEGAGNAVTSICPAVKKRFEVHRRDRAVFLHPGLDVHQHRMTPAMTIEDLFARQSTFHRTAGNHRQLADNDFVVEWIALAAKAPEIGRA